MEITYKTLQSAFIEMSKGMKARGECNLGAQSLLDRFSKALSLKSRQELKIRMSPKLTESTIIENESPTADLLDLIRQDVADYLGEEFSGLYRSTERFTQSIQKHQINGVKEFASDLSSEHWDDFMTSERGIYLNELSLKRTESDKSCAILNAYCNRHRHLMTQSVDVTSLSRNAHIHGLCELTKLVVYKDIVERLCKSESSLFTLASACLISGKTSKEELSKNFYGWLQDVI